MKFLNKSIYALSLVSMMGLWSCSQEDVLQGGDVTAKGHPVPVTLTVSRGDAQTRTVIKENNEGGLDDKWEQGDRLHVYNTQGVDVGTLTITEGVDTDTGVFYGEVTAEQGEQELSLWYYDEEYMASEASNSSPKMKFSTYTYSTETVPSLYLDLRSQDFASAEDFKKVDVLSKKVTLNVNGEKATVVKDEVLTAYLTFARFSLNNIPTGTKGTLDIYDVAAYGSNNTIGEEYYNTKNQWSFDLGKNSVANRHTDKTNIVVNNVEGGKDVYVAFVSSPGTEKGNAPDKGYKLGFKFTATNGDVYAYEFENETVLWAGKYYNNGVGTDGKVKGAEIPMEKVGGDEVDDSDNPGNFAIWGANNLNIDPKGVPFSPVFASEVDGWTNNIRSMYDYGGWCRAIEYTNGMINGLMTSQGGTCYYYQWGRFLGFPTNAATGNTTILNASLINTRVGYLGSGGVPVKYLAAYMGNSSSYDVQRSKDWAIVYGQTNNSYLDYIYGNKNNSSWYDRSDNPAPTGYRIPTMDELSVFIPSTEEVNGSYAEVKTINGVKYAVKWQVGTVSGYKYVDVTSVKTNESTVNVNSSLFTSQDAKTVKIIAYGYMMDDGTLSGSKTSGLYWSSDSDTQNAFDNVEGKGGRALYLEFTNNKVVICELCVPFGFGAPVMLVKDDSMVESTIKPWLPYSWEFKNLPGYK